MAALLKTFTRAIGKNDRLLGNYTARLTPDQIFERYNYLKKKYSENKSISSIFGDIDKIVYDMKLSKGIDQNSMVEVTKSILGRIHTIVTEKQLIEELTNFIVFLRIYNKDIKASHTSAAKSYVKGLNLPKVPTTSSALTMRINALKRNTRRNRKSRKQATRRSQRN